MTDRKTMMLQPPTRERPTYSEPNSIANPADPRPGLLNAANQPADGVPDSNATAASTKPKRRRTWARFLFDILLYLGLYIVISAVSIGPFFWHWFGAVYCDGPKWIARFYMPLGIACEFCPPLDWAVNAWIRWWIL